ncbi:MAG: hypothetical protein K9N07_07310 [Candidatus Cloacimonetes bacterium]|nr:hypothetical protein [Candidatus Cloacimonadota bacterium]
MRIKEHRLNFFQKVHLTMKRIVDQTFFAGLTSQLITLLILFLLLLAAGSKGFEQIKGESAIKAAESSYFEKGTIWSIVHATDPGYLSGDYNQGHQTLFWFGLIVTLAGWFLLSGFIMTIFINFYQSHLNEIEGGLVRYYFWKGHRLILGWNLMGASVVHQLFTGNSHPVVILSLSPPKLVREDIAIMISDSDNPHKMKKKRVIIYQGSFDSSGELKYHNFNKIETIVILEDTIGTNQNVKNIQTIIKINDLIDESKGKEKISCYVHLPDFRTYDILQDVDLNIVNKINFHPFNFFEDWARRLWSILPQIKDGKLENKKDIYNYVPLAYHPISRESEKNVHLVIIGFGQMGQALAAQAARICHYANGQKTKITVIDDRDSVKKMQIFSSHCFLNRIPDVEFELLNQSAEETATRDFLINLIQDEKQITTIVVCISDPDESISVALSLPQQVQDADIPILIRQETRCGLSDLVAKLMKDKKWKDIRFFGMLHECFGLDRRTDILPRQAHEIYRQSYGENSIPAWEELSESLRWSNRYQVDSYVELLRSAGYQFVPARETIENDAFDNEEEIEWLAEREHDRWVAEKLMAGWKQADLSGCTSDDERKSRRDNFRMLHTFIVPFNELDTIVAGTTRKDISVIKNLNTLMKIPGIELAIKKAD